MSKSRSHRSPYKALIVGAGRIGFSLGLDRLREQPASHAFALSANRRIRLAGAVDIDPSQLTAWKKHFPATNTYTEIKDAMAAEKPDIVVLAVPEEIHAATAQTVFPFRPRLVILEKPVAPNLREARLITQAARHWRVPVTVNHERRFSRDYAMARNVLEHDTLGELHTVRAALWSGAPVWTKNAAVNGACSLLHDGTHLVDTVRFLLDRDLPRPVLDFSRKGRGGSIAHLIAHYDIGKKLFVSVEIAGNKKVFDFEIEVTGSEGRLHLGNGFSRLMRRSPSRLYSGFFSLRRERRWQRPRETGYFSLMIKNCVDFLDGQTELVSPLSEGMKTLHSLYDIAALLIS